MCAVEFCIFISGEKFISRQKDQNEANSNIFHLKRRNTFEQALKRTSKFLGERLFKDVKKTLIILNVKIPRSRFSFCNGLFIVIYSYSFCNCSSPRVYKIKWNLQRHLNMGPSIYWRSWIWISSFWRLLLNYNNLSRYFSL